ncbi:uncharacterized protein LOC144988820 [Oryzias latipes]
MTSSRTGGRVFRFLNVSSGGHVGFAGCEYATFEIESRAFHFSAMHCDFALLQDAPTSFFFPSASSLMFTSWRRLVFSPDLIWYRTTECSVFHLQLDAKASEILNFREFTRKSPFHQERAVNRIPDLTDTAVVLLSVVVVTLLMLPSVVPQIWLTNLF